MKRKMTKGERENNDNLKELRRSAILLLVAALLSDFFKWKFHSQLFTTAFVGYAVYVLIVIVNNHLTEIKDILAKRGEDANSEDDSMTEKQT